MNNYNCDNMEKYNIRVENAKKDFMHMDGTLWENVERLWKMGYSLRVISEVTGITRSKLQRLLSEDNKTREDDVRTQDREYRVRKARAMFKSGKNNQEVASLLGVNIKTVQSYKKQLYNRGDL